MKKFAMIVLLSFFLSGCATVSLRKAEYLAENYNEVAGKSVAVVPVIDARSDKTEYDHGWLVNKGLLDKDILALLKGKGFSPKTISVDPGQCGSLEGTHVISDIVCFDLSAFPDQDLFFLVSVDQYVAPESMHVVGATKVTGVMYSRKSGSIIWKDTIAGKYSNTYGSQGPGAYLGMLLTKAMSKGSILYNNVFSTVTELFNSLPSASKQ